MKPGIQTLFAEAGEAACYAFDLIDVSQEWFERQAAKEGKLPCVLDPCQSLQRGIDLKRIHYNPDDENDEQNFYVEAPALFLQDLTGVPWEVWKAEPDYEGRAAPDEYVILRSERVSTGKTMGHFWRRRFNSLRHSLCVERGKIVSLRVCRPLA